MYYFIANKAIQTKRTILLSIKSNTHPKQLLQGSLATNFHLLPPSILLLSLCIRIAINIVMNLISDSWFTLHSLARVIHYCFKPLHCKYLHRRIASEIVCGRLPVVKLSLFVYHRTCNWTHINILPYTANKWLIKSASILFTTLLVRETFIKFKESINNVNTRIIKIFFYASSTPAQSNIASYVWFRKSLNGFVSGAC